MYNKIAQVLQQVLQISQINNDGSVRKLPALNLTELSNERNYDTQLLKYNLQIFAKTKEDLEEVLKKLYSKQVFEITEKDKKTLCTIKTGLKTVISYKDHLFQAEKVINVQVLSVRKAA